MDTFEAWVHDVKFEQFKPGTPMGFMSWSLQRKKNSQGINLACGVWAAENFSTMPTGRPSKEVGVRPGVRVQPIKTYI